MSCIAEPVSSVRADYDVGAAVAGLMTWITPPFPSATPVPFTSTTTSSSGGRSTEPGYETPIVSLICMRTSWPVIVNGTPTSAPYTRAGDDGSKIESMAVKRKITSRHELDSRLLSELAGCGGSAYGSSAAGSHPAHRRHGQLRGAMARATSIDPRAATGVSADAVRGILRCGITRRSGNNDRLSTPWREVISIARVARSFSSGAFKRAGAYLENSSPRPRGCARNCGSHSSRHCQIVCCADQWLVGQGGGTSRDDGRALSGAAESSPPFVLGLSHL